MIAAGVAYFVLVFGLGFILGWLRHLLMGLGLGRDMLVFVEIPLMLAYAWWAAGWCAARFGVATGSAPRFAMGMVMLMLLRLAELAVGMTLMGQTFQTHLAALATARGAWEMAPQVMAALFPLIRARLTGR